MRHDAHFLTIFFSSTPDARRQMDMALSLTPDPKRSFLQREMMNVEHVDQDIFITFIGCPARVAVDPTAEPAAQRKSWDVVTKAVFLDRYGATPKASLVAILNVAAVGRLLCKNVICHLTLSPPYLSKEEILDGDPVETLYFAGVESAGPG